MKQLIALAAVLGLAVSSWGLTLQAAPVAPGTTAVLVEAQVGNHLTGDTITNPGGMFSIYAAPTIGHLQDWIVTGLAKIRGYTGG